MRQRVKGLLKLLFIGVAILVTTQAIQAEVSSSEKQAKLKLARIAYDTGYYAEELTKAYLYKGNNEAVRQASAELKEAPAEFLKAYKVLDQSINNPKNKNLLLFMKMSYDELIDLIKQPYSLDNAQIALDLSATILEGARFIADDLKKSVNFQNKHIINGFSIYFESIAKYYMAYQAGIKDDNTIKLMKDTVDAAGKAIDDVAKSNHNTVAMNQKMTKVKRLWSIVYKFYLDIDKGGLPFIVYKTSNDLAETIKSYELDMEKVMATDKALQ